MAEDQHTIFIEPVDGHSALKMTWPRYPTELTVQTAFNQVMEHLHVADSTMHIIVDLKSDPQLPITYTFHQVVTGPFAHEFMGNWLVIGTNRRAKMISDLMNVFREKGNILWFDSEEGALKHLEQLK